MKFTHLHVHSHYSLLDGLAKVDDLVAGAKGLGYEALALTDHGVLYGAVEFYKKAKKHGLKPIIGVEAYVASRDRFSRVPKIDSKRYHLVLLAKNEEGYCNLVKLVSRAWLEGFYYRPRIDKALLQEHAHGLIALSACLGAEIPQALLVGDKEGAQKIVREYQEVFGRENFFIEIGFHPNIPESQRVFPALVELARATHAPLVATQDVHYLRQGDTQAHDVLLAIQTGNKVEEEERLTMRDDDFSLLPPQEMIKRFADLPEAIENTQVITDACEFEFQLGKPKLPHYPLPFGETADSYLLKLARQGLKKRRLEESQEVASRLHTELNVIEKTGFASYFLIVQDFVNWAKSDGIVVGPGRGSATGSLVSYLLGITDVDPLKYQLIFERFLTPDRISMPDIDIDFTDTRRDEVFSYLKRRYGDDRVAQIITFGTMAARAAVRDVGRALGYPYGFCDRIAKLIPPVLSLKESMEAVAELKELYGQDEAARKLLDTAQQLEGVARHASVHACGVVITPEPLAEYLPLQFAPQDETRVITQYDMRAVEDLGLLKIDLLGIRNLTTIEETKALVRQRSNREVVLEEPFDDRKTFALFQKAETIGVFQVESGGMRRYLKELKPDTLEDIIALLALYRPGPMELIPSYIRRKFKKERVSYLHAKLEPILKGTYGIAVYQEQLMKIAQELASFSLTEADVLRKAVGKKIASLLEEQRVKLIEGMVRNKIDRKTAQEIWEWYQPFARYGFNRSHSVPYAFVAYYTAYLKSNYPVEFMTALFNAEGSNLDRAKVLIEEARRMGLEVLPPDINESGKRFTIAKDNRSIHFGLGAVKNVGEHLVEAIEQERTAHGAFSSLQDFLQRVEHKDLNRKSLESLSKAGAFDRLEERAVLVYNIEEILDFSSKVKRKQVSAQASLFGGGGVQTLRLKPAPRILQEEKLRWEKFYLGFYLSGHPLEFYKERLEKHTTEIRNAMERRAPGSLTLGGIVNAVKRVMTKANEPMVFAELEDFSGKIEVIVFPKTYARIPNLWSEGRVLLVQGKVETRNDGPQLICEAAEEVSSA